MIIHQTCEVIWDSLSEQYFWAQQNKKHWKQIAKNFEKILKLTNCVEAIGRKHIAIKSPINSGSLYFNYAR